MSLPDPATDLGDDIRAAFAAHEDADPAPANDPASAAPAVAPEPEVALEAKTETPRGEDGKFVAKAPETGQTLPVDQPEAASPEAPELIRPPASWSAAAKAAFSTLPLLIQEEAVKRERDVDHGLQQRANELKKYEPIDQVLAPYRDKFALAGVRPEQAIQQLLAAQDALEKDPISALLYLARNYGVHPQQFVQSLGQAPVQPTLPPELQHLVQEVTTLKQSLSQREQSEAQAREAALTSQIEQFRADPKHLYFENVSEDMALLLQNGRATDLADAYDKACWSNPEVRTLILADQARAAQEEAGERAKAEQAQATQRAKEARKAAGSVTGSRGQGAPIASNGVDPNASIVDDVRRAFEDVSGRA
jgi:hypothetical protein